MDPKETVGKTFGCIQVERVEKERISNGHTRSMCYGRCINCGASVKYAFSELHRRPPSGCKACPNEFRAHPANKDLTGAEFPAFRVLGREGAALGAKTLWRCSCKICGQECLIPQRYLPIYKSCGCLAQKSREAGQKYNQEIIHQDGTSYSAIRPERALNCNNTSGVRGVCKGQKRAWRAYITIRRRQISLGEYDSIEAAIAARKAGEEKYYTPAIEAFEADGVAVKGAYVPKRSDRAQTQNIRQIGNRYAVKLYLKGKCITVGTFDTLDAAIAARDSARADLGMAPVMGHSKTKDG